MVSTDRWWAGMAEERFWLESTDREDLGVDLRAPLQDEAGRDNWRYTLFREAQVGDIVFHYDKRASAITAASRIAGPPVSAPIVWAARGSYARERGAEPAVLPGYRMPLTDYQPLSAPITLEALRQGRENLRAIYENVAPTGVSRYFPFELSERPVRPLQGYAFKLPAALVAAYAPMRAIRDAVHGRRPETEIEQFHNLIDTIEAAAGQYGMSRLQQRRTEIGGLGRQAKSIFGLRDRSRDWAFHLGGRGELQFNVGLDEMPDGRRAFRAGVAFSLETSRSLPDIARLEPKIAWFNAWMRDHPEAFPDLAMWSFRDHMRSTDQPVGPIPQPLIETGTFIFVGDRQPLSEADPHLALRAMDRLLPLWDWVESRRGVAIGEAAPTSKDSIAVLETLRLDSGRELDGRAWTKATTRERTFDVCLRHAEIQRQLKIALLNEGCVDVIFEPRIGSRAIDVVARHGQALWFYEVKTGGSDRACLREAIGQLLEYALWPGATPPERLVVVGEPPLSTDGVAYLAQLNAGFPIPIDYRQLTLA